MATKLRTGRQEADGSTGRSLALVLNDKAGALLGGGDHAGQLRERLQEAGITLQDIPPGRLPDRIAEAARAGADAVVVAGGDGTVACACQALAGADLALGIIPGGTMNLLARDLKLPVDDLAAATDIIVAGQIRRIDVGQVGEHVFACACMLGTPARIGHHREIGRSRGNGLLAWLHVGRAAFKAVRRHRAMRLVLTVDGVATRVKTHSLTITVNPLDDASGRAFGRTVLDGGRLYAYVVRRRSAWDLVRLALRLATGSSHDAALQRLDGCEIEVTGNTEAMRIMIDGEEHLLKPPLRFTVRPGALQVFAPGGSPGQVGTPA